MIHLLQVIFNKLSETNRQVYFELVPVKDPITQLPPSYPYIVFSFPNSVDVESNRQDYTLQINIWDNKADTTILENLTSEIDRKLYQFKHVDEYQLLMFERENRLMIPDEDSSIKRRQLRYTVKQYERVV